MSLIQPHGSVELQPRFVFNNEKHCQLLHEAESLPSILISSAAAANAVMLGAGYFNPLHGYMNLNDALSVAETLHTTDGLFWPVPVLNMVADTSAIAGAKRIALRDPNTAGNPVLAIMDVDVIETISEPQMKLITEQIYGTLDPRHPGVAAFGSAGRQLISGPIEVLNFSYFSTDYPDTFRTAVEIRQELIARDWRQVVAFQTRNPMHRAHEELCKLALASVNADGILIHMLLGKLKPGDIPATVRDASIRTMVDTYFPQNTVMVAGYGFDMLYAGPREAVLHAVFRQNCGCSHLIIGRDHAGVGHYYGAFDAQNIFDHKVPKGALKIEIFRADHTAYSKKLNKVVMMRDVPDHSMEDFILLSGTKVRELLSNGIAPPPEFSRPEVAQILMNYYQNL